MIILRLLLGAALCSVACGVPISARDEIAKAKPGKPPVENVAEPKAEPKPGDEPITLKSGGTTTGERAQGKADSRSKELSVADILAGLKIDEASLIYNDEPPGKLWALSGVITLPGSTAAAHLRIELKFRIVSANFDWDKNAVRAATVARVVITPVGAGE